jgi:2-C-methyl-D-erythritol 4-phosphate cytidylyltransferase
MGAPIRLVMGEPTNLKVTYPADLLIAEAFLRARKQ